jgi:hypothetical protein
VSERFVARSPCDRAKQITTWDVDDPAAFLSESVHEIFDEYYSVSLSF